MGFTCCGIAIQNRKSFDEHQTKFHFLNSTFKNPLFKCPLCGSSINLLKNYRSHLIKSHVKEACDIFIDGIPPLPIAQPVQQVQLPRFASNPFEVRSNVNPIEIVHQNVAESNTNPIKVIPQNIAESHLFEVDDFEPVDQPMDSNESADDDIPYLEKEEESEQINTDSEHQILVAFAKLLVSLKYSLNVAHKHLIQIVTVVLTFIFILLSKKVLTSGLLVQIKKIAESRHYQDKYSDSLKVKKHPEKNFYYTDLREVIERYLSDRVICKQLFFEKKRKQIFGKINNYL